MDLTWHWLVASRGDSAVEGDRERVECGLSPHCPSCLTAAGGVQGAGHQVEAHHRGLFGWEVPAGPNSPRVASIQGFHRVRRADDAVDLDVVVQERHELTSGVLPQLGDRRILRAPLLDELGEPFLGRGLGGRGVDRADILGDLISVLA